MGEYVYTSICPPKRTINQACYSILSFFLLMPFVFMGLFWSDKIFYMTDAGARLYHPAAYYAAKVGCNRLVGRLLLVGLVG